MSFRYKFCQGRVMIGLSVVTYRLRAENAALWKRLGDTSWQLRKTENNLASARQQLLNADAPAECASDIRAALMQSANK